MPNSWKQRRQFRRDRPQKLEELQMIWSQTARLAALDYVLWDYGAPKKFRDAVRTKLTADLEKKSRDKIDMTYLYGSVNNFV